MAGNYDFPDPEWQNVSEDAKDFIRKILVVNPEQRATAEQCLQHRWIKDHVNPSKDKNIKRLETFNPKKFKDYTAKYKQTQETKGVDEKYAFKE